MGTGLQTDQQAWRLVHVVPCLSDTGDDGVGIAGDRAEAPRCDTLTGRRADHLQGATPCDPRMAAILKKIYKIYIYTIIISQLGCTLLEVLFMVLASRASGCLFGHPNP